MHAYQSPLNNQSSSFSFRKLLARPFSVDLAIYAAFLLLGVLYFVFYIKTPDLTLDATYVELTRSLVEKHSYEFDFLPETMFPPGFPVILAFVERLFGVSQAIPYHVIAIFATLGLFVAYELLRHVETRGVAAAICLLLATSQSLFSFVTELVFSEMPYFFFSWAVLFLAWKMDRSKWSPAQFLRMLLLALALIFSIMVRSVGLTLAIALCAWTVAPLFSNSSLVRRRAAGFLVPVILGFTSQILWAAWARPRQVTEWSLPGWPQSYTSQVLVKNGNYPELGYARLSDLPGRIATNTVAHAAEVSQLLTRRETMTQFWSSPLIIGVIVLIAVGLFSSLLKEGGELFDWYFLTHEALFLIWPWDTETRFLLPVVPLAWLYLWRGGKVVVNFAKSRPQTAGACFFLSGAVLAFESAEVAAHSAAKLYQPLLASLFWVSLALLGGILFFLERAETASRLARWIEVPRSRKTSFARSLRAVPVLLLLGLVAYGGALQFDTARYNEHPDVFHGLWNEDIQAAKWIRSHEPADEVVMARKQDLVFHYTQHRVVWFPPISDPQRLMEGMRRLNVRLVLVVARPKPYWFPAEDTCFNALQQAFPSSFTLVYSDADAKIYEVRPPAQTQAANHRPSEHAPMCLRPLAMC